MLDLVVPDAGPLMTFGIIDRLDLLDRFNCAILVTDMVAAEVRCGPDTAPDKAIFERWFAAQSNRIQTVATTYGTMWNALPPDVQARIKRQIPDAGEQSIREFLQKIGGHVPEEDQILVLFEEDAVKRMPFESHVHLIHSYAFMVALEEMGVIESAEALRAQVVSAGRNLARDPFERRAHGSNGDVADWQEDYDAAADGPVPGAGRAPLS